MTIYENYLDKEIEELQSGASIVTVAWVSGEVYNYTIPNGTGILLVMTSGPDEANNPEVLFLDGVEGQQVTLFSPPESTFVVNFSNSGLGPLSVGGSKRVFFVAGAWRT